MAVVAAASAVAVTVVAATEATVAARVATAVARAATVVVRVATVVSRVARAVTAAVTRCSCHEAYEGLDVISTFLTKVVTYAGLTDTFAGPVTSDPAQYKIELVQLTLPLIDNQ